MNIFALDENPVKAAEMLCDTHVIKMPLESVQLWSTYVRDLGEDFGYKRTHSGHPCSVWMKISTANAEWMHKYTLALFEEFTKRRNKKHQSQDVYFDIIKNCFNKYNGLKTRLPLHDDLIIKKPSIESLNWFRKLAEDSVIELEEYGRNGCLIKFKKIFYFIDFYPAMPTQYRVGNTVIDMYKNYYINDKIDIAQWNYIPTRGEWFRDLQIQKV